jgi:DNA-binding GntR family transcriptional regulator
VVTGALLPGTKITEGQLADELGVSRPTVREALGQLARDGWVVQVPYAGMTVASLSEQDIRDVAELRITLDLLALRSIYADSTGRRLNMVADAWGQLETYANDPDPLVRHDAHVAFHRGLWEASENQILLRQWPSMEAHIALAIAEDEAVRPDPVRVRHSHQSLLEAIMSRDITRAQLALLEHTVDNAEQLAALVRANALG